MAPRSGQRRSYRSADPPPRFGYHLGRHDVGAKGFCNKIDGPPRPGWPETESGGVAAGSALPRAAAGDADTRPGEAPAEVPGSVWDDSRRRYAHDGFKTYWEALERVATA